MHADGEINLLIALDKLDQANQLINVLRNASYVVHSAVIEATTDLNQLLDQRPWDLAIIELEHQSIQVRNVIAKIKKHVRSTPIIAITTDSSGNPYVEGLRMGAGYVVPMDEDQYFLLVTAASLANLQHRHMKDYWKQQFQEAELRCTRLMSNSKDAIAIIQEGTFVFVNKSYSQLFGYQDTDEMLLLPVIDTIAERSHAEIKPYLKPLLEDKSINKASIDISGITPNAQDVGATINISQVLYQNLPALQFLVAHELLDFPTGIEPGTNPGSQHLSDIEPKKIIASIDQAILKAARTEEQSLALYIRADQIEEFDNSSLPTAKGQLLSALLAYITEQMPSAQTISKFSGDTLVAIINLSTVSEGRQLAETLCAEIANETFSVGDQSVVLSLTICVSALNHSKQTGMDCLKQCQQAIATGDGVLNKSGNKPNIYCFENEALDRFESEQSVIEFGRLLLEKRLIGIEFQPIAALQGEVSEYYEILMRPKVNEYPYPVPDDFIDRIFKTEVAKDIDRWVILEAIKGLHDKLKERPETKLFINLSAASIQDSGFTAWLKIALQTANVLPRHLILQLREIDVGRYIDQSEKLIRQIKQLQAETALTHFGLSINPLLILDRLAIDFIKVDKILVQEATKGGDGAKTMESILSSVQELTPEVIVPYVENPSIMPMLWQHRVAYIQGYYVQEPMATMNYDFIEGI